MDKVWVVEQGQYSDYRVVGAYSSQQNAETAAAFLNSRNDDSDRATVAVWPMDPAIEDINAGRTQFEVSMHRDGTVSECGPFTDMYGGGILNNTVEICGPGIVHGRDERYLYAVVWATDADHAVKIVNDRRGQLIANGEWQPACDARCDAVDAVKAEEY